MNGRKQISFLLLFGFSVLLGHSLTPHHHHANVPFGTSTDECQADHDENHETGKDPLHCHAFNNVDIFKDSKTIIQQEPKEISTMMLPVAQNNTDAPSTYGTQRYICLILPDQSIKYSGAISLRAPPCTV